ncbi:MAG: UbiA family prenyltransferase [Bdellovibrionales bacterium]|nr:UbiA family prenyltransferase [Bdellovibrionales bacterium]
MELVRTSAVIENSTKFIFVDLDHTLVATDLAWEAVISLLKKSPLSVFKILLWRMRGLSYLKQRLVEAVPLQVESLPYRVDVLEWVQKQKRDQVSIFLATGSPQSWADQVARHLSFFDGTVGSSETVNLNGAEKLRAIRSICGEAKFTYLGDSALDLPIWQEAETAIAVRPSSAVLRRLHGLPRHQSASTIGEIRNLPRAIWKAIRPSHWTKNILTLVPLVASHQVTNPGLGLRALWAAVCFSLVASAVYVFNDIFDLQSDRQMPSKNKRPIAAGQIFIPQGFLIGAVLLFCGLGAGLFLGSKFEFALFAYFGITCLYTFQWKKVMGLDVVCLAALFTSRIFAGGYAIDVKVSNWLLGFSLFFFFGLACLKRYIELGEAESLKRSHFAGRGYAVDDRQPILTIGAASSLMSLLVLVLYINGEDVRPLYRQPGMLWWLMPLFLYWVSRIWILAHRGQIPGDPIAFAIKDRASHITLLLAGIIFFIAQS